MLTVKSVDELFDNYALMGATREDTARGRAYRFPEDAARDPSFKGTIEFFGDVATFSLASSDCIVPREYVCRCQFQERYIGLSFNDIGSVETYRRRDDARTLDEGLHFFVAASRGPFFMRIAAGTHLRFTALYFMEKFFEENGILLPEGFWAHAEKVLNIGERQIPGLGVICRQILASPLEGEAYQLFVRGQGLAAAALIIDYVARTGDTAAAPSDAATENAVNRAKAILKAEYVHPPTVQALAKRLGTNKNRLQSGFSAMEGRTVSAYLRAVRMEHALDLLADTNLSIEAVAEQVGYQGKANFYKAFRKTYGYAPSEVRSFIRSAT